MEVESRYHQQLCAGVAVELRVVDPLMASPSLAANSETASSATSQLCSSSSSGIDQANAAPLPVLLATIW